MTKLDADGILYTEFKKNENRSDVINAEYPTVLVKAHFHAAHVYKLIFSHVKLNFAIAGLLPDLDVSAIIGLIGKVSYESYDFSAVRRLPWSLLPDFNGKTDKDGRVGARRIFGSNQKLSNPWIS